MAALGNNTGWERKEVKRGYVIKFQAAVTYSHLGILSIHIECIPQLFLLKMLELG